MKKELSIKNMNIKGASIKLASYVRPIKKTAENFDCLSDFLSKNSEFSSNIAVKIDKVRTKLADLAKNNPSNKSVLTELDKQLFWCFENLKDQSELFNYCVNTKKEVKNND